MKQVIQELMMIGFTENEAKTYVYLLKKQVFTATEISRIAGVNRSKIYQVLGNLVRKGLCIEKPGKVRKYEAVDPEIAFEKVREAQEKKIERISSITTILSPIFQQQQINTAPLDFIEVYGTPSTIINKYNALELEASKFVYSFCKRPYAMADSNLINQEQLTSMRKGVIYKSIFEIEPDQPAWFAQKMLSFVKQGEEIRVSPHLPIKLHIYDEKTVMFSMINKISPKENLTYMVIEHEDLTEALISTFNCYWQNSWTVKEYMKKEGISEKEAANSHKLHK